MATGIFSAAMLLALIGILPLGSATEAEMKLFLLFAVLTCLVGFIELVFRDRRLEINTEAGQIVFTRPAIPFMGRTVSYPLADFSSVRSYWTPGRLSENLVELVTRSGGEALLVARYGGVRQSKGFLFIAAGDEHPDAAALRKAIAQECGLKDDGYLGTRWRGAYVSPTK